MASTGYTFAHENIHCIMHYGNINLKITTSHESEEICKVAILGQLAEKLSKDLKYSKPVFFDLHQGYGDDNANIFVSYDRNLNGFLDWGNYYWNRPALPLDDNHRGTGHVVEDSVLIIRQFAKTFHCQTMLKVLEHAIRNHAHIQSKQTKIEYGVRTPKLILQTIDTLEIKKAIAATNSEALYNVLSSKVYRPGKVLENGISYYFQNNRYVFFRNYNEFPNITSKTVESVIASFDNIFCIKSIERRSTALFFDTNSSFYYFTYSTVYDYPSGKTEFKDIISKRQVIENCDRVVPTFNVQQIGHQTVAISFWYWSETGTKTVDDSYIIVLGGGNRERILLYFPQEDKLIQDLDVLIM